MTWFKYSCYDECFTYFYLDVTLDECPSGLLLLDMWDLIFIFIWWECMCKYIKLLSEAIINVRLKWKMELFSVWIIIKHRMCNVLNTLVALFIWKGVKCCSVMVKLYLIWISKKKKKSWKWQEKFSCYWVKGHNTFLIRTTTTAPFVGGYTVQTLQLCLPSGFSHDLCCPAVCSQVTDGET